MLSFACVGLAAAWMKGKRFLSVGSVSMGDSGKIVHLYGIFVEAPDYNGSQIQPVRIVVEE